MAATVKTTLLALAVFLATACASGRGVKDFEAGADVIHVPIVRITNANYYDADVWLAGRKVASNVRALTGDVTVILHPADVMGDGMLKFVVRLKSPGAAQGMRLPPTIYHPGRKILVNIQPQLDQSQAW